MERVRTLARGQRCCQLRPVSQGPVKTRARAAAWGHSAEGRQAGAVARPYAAAAVCATAWVESRMK
eukprot:5474034-Pleurochrysis_carterae.AAC.1